MPHNSKIKVRLREYLLAKGVEITPNGFIRCPWHDDKNPSCKVNEDYVHCFGCNESGDIFKVAAAILGVSCDRENFREIAADVERTIGLPEWQPPTKSMRSPPRFRLSESVIYRGELLKDFAKAIDTGNTELAYLRALELFGLFLLPEKAQ